ncbi:hypothetical protein [Embleya sp. NPDC050493]|uniref:hypothetical protein n=1 Tax=Embleya sp. NPDC050493 TaxID=3363989 RepID=UPI0037A267D0
MRLPAEGVDLRADAVACEDPGSAGQRIGDRRRARAAGSITAHRIELLERLGMV